MVRRVPDFLVDLLEIAAYVYCADRATSRGGDVQLGMGRDWRRKFRFVIPVREPRRWKDPKVLEWLRSVLFFLSEDNCTFEFERARDPPPYPDYFDFGNDQGRADEVVLFSGGLDSLSGTLEELSKGHRVALVSHRSATKIVEDQRRLVTALKERFPQQVVHVPVLVNMHFRDVEYTQRTRSFLYASMASVVAFLFGDNRIRFFENGVMSINLPISEQLVGNRASRTTHPQTLHQLQQLFSALFSSSMRVENSFIWKTRRDVVQSIMENRGEELIAHAVSCSRRRNLPKPYTHCGCCVQCIDRRFAILGASAAAHDPAEAYKVELFGGPREAPKDRALAESYVRVHVRLRDITEDAFFDLYGGETSRVLTALQHSADEIGFRVLNLYRRNGQTVAAVLQEAVERHSEQLVLVAARDGCLGRWARTRGRKDCIAAVVGGGRNRGRVRSAGIGEKAADA